MTISTHVLDTARGRPAAGVPITLSFRGSNGIYAELGRGETDSDGRCKTLVPSGHTFAAGVYRIVFDTGAYFAALGVEGFYPEAAIVFEIKKPEEHFHVPLLVSPFGYSTYRGS
ncbi:MAG TPA: hydroxyisourate hydrolase [Polyangiaceae bacterium]|jgi:5-hydroxyisourate hydrolase|nr:hydroxyisourate hydrolase [Polyangiaceae bacterium]